MAARPGESFTLPALLLVDGEQVTTDADALAGVTVTAEVVEHTKGPKIKILHTRTRPATSSARATARKLTQVRVTGITSA